MVRAIKLCSGRVKRRATHHQRSKALSRRPGRGLKRAWRSTTMGTLEGLQARCCRLLNSRRCWGGGSLKQCRSYKLSKLVQKFSLHRGVDFVTSFGFLLLLLNATIHVAFQRHRLKCNSPKPCVSLLEFFVCHFDQGFL